MAAGKALIESVARALDPKIGMTAAEISFHLPEPKPSNRAIRYAIKALVDAGRARRHHNRMPPASTGSHGGLREVWSFVSVEQAKPAEQQAAE